MSKVKARSLELCAGGGGQALGLEQAGFHHEALVDIDHHSCQTLLSNRPKWDVRQENMADIDGKEFHGIDLLSGGLPCPPFSIAGKQLGKKDERNCFPHAMKLVKDIKPKAILFENVRGILSAKFQEYRDFIERTLNKLGYSAEWRIVRASDFGVPQLRPRVVCVAFRNDVVKLNPWPMMQTVVQKPPTVGEAILDLMSQNEWKLAQKWKSMANKIAPTIVGGSSKHGGPDLGPMRAKKEWIKLGVDGKGIANDAPEEHFVGMPRLTLRMVARLQGFPDSWFFAGGKTSTYRQIGNAFPPPVARVLGEKIMDCIKESL